MLEKFGQRCERFVRSYMPDPFVLVLLLTLFTFALTLWTQKPMHMQLIGFWYSGFWELLSFAMQMVLIVVTGEAIAESPFAQKVLKRFSKWPKSAASAILMLTFFSILLGWLHWGFGLVFSSLAARGLAQSLSDRKIAVHYPILATGAYMSMLLWHAGTTASAPLLINTPGHFLEKEIGLIPLAETIFSQTNLIVCGGLLFFIPLLIYQLSPKRGVHSIEYFPEAKENISHKKHTEEKAKTFAEKLETSYTINAFIGILGLAFLADYFKSNGLNLNHNIVNFLLLILGMLLHRNPTEYLKAVTKSVKGTSGIILQFPFYGGIMGIMRNSGLGHDIAHLFIQFADERTLPLYAYFSSVATKLFIPSGGGEWAIEGPVMLGAAKQLGASIGKVTMGIAYGNMVGNMFQPFWAIPLLSIMGLKAKEMMGYCLAVFFFVFPVLAIALLFS